MKIAILLTPFCSGELAVNPFDEYAFWDACDSGTVCQEFSATAYRDHG